MADNIYEVNNRWRKAMRLAAHCHKGGVLACEIPKVSREYWFCLARAVGVNPPSFDADGHSETVHLVGDILRVFETAEKTRDTQAGEKPVDLTALKAGVVV